jgi:hypothetical protein
MGRLLNNIFNNSISYESRKIGFFVPFRSFSGVETKAPFVASYSSSTIYDLMLPGGPTDVCSVSTSTAPDRICPSTVRGCSICLRPSTCLFPNNKKTIVNLTGVPLEEAASSALSTGLNYAVTSVMSALPEETAEEVQHETIRILANPD